MEHLPRLGLAFPPTIPADRLVDLARTVEEAGLDDLWVWEDCFAHSGIAAASAALASTSRIRVGLSLMPAPLRTVALTAMEINTVSGMFPGRFLPGVGHGVQPWMGQAGVRAASPMTLLREYVAALQSLLAGEEVSTSGEYVHLDKVQLRWPPRDRTVALGGHGPKTLDFSARNSPVTLLAGALTGDEVRRSCSLVRQARTESGLPTGPDAYEVVFTHIAATGPGAQERVDVEVPKWGAETGHGVGVGGDAETIAASVRALVEQGVTSIAFQATEDEPDLTGFVRFLGQEVRPLLQAPRTDRTTPGPVG